jgi:hypothetical protein
MKKMKSQYMNDTEKVRARIRECPLKDAERELRSSQEKVKEKFHATHQA